MRAGRLRKLITIQRRSVTESPSGEPIEVWTTIISRRPAAIWSPQSGQETFSDPQLVAREKVEWLIRESADVVDLTPLDRIIYPALAEESPEDVPVERNVYDIVSVHEYLEQDRLVGRRIVTARRPDVTS